MRSRGFLLLLAGLLFAAGLLYLSRADAPETTLAAGERAAAAEELAAPSAPAATPEPEPTTPAPDPDPPTIAAEPEPETDTAPASAPPPTLEQRLAALLADPVLAGTRIGLTVLDDQGDVVFSRDAASPLLPASTQKVVVAAASLAALGPDFRYVTRVFADTAPDPDGVVAGNLVLVGSGDPALASPTYIRDIYPRRPHTSLATLADRIVASGVRHVTGGVLGDPSIFPDEPLAEGWLDSYVEDLDATPSSGLTIDGGQKLFVRDGRLRARASADPAQEAAAALLGQLAERGVRVDGGVGRTSGDTASVPLARVSSPPLSDMLAHLMQRSDNHMTDALFRTLGVVGNGDGSWTGAAAATRAALEPLGLDWSGAVLADGSGLSRADRLPAALLARLNLAMSRSNAGALWDGSMAVAGHSGTLRRRLLGTLAESRLRAKTGSLRDVRALSGSVAADDGRRYHFTLLVNDVAGGQRPAVRLLQDEVVLALAEDLHDCVRIDADQLRCAA